MCVCVCLGVCVCEGHITIQNNLEKIASDNPIIESTRQKWKLYGNVYPPNYVNKSI
jgi:hypothetical protein